MISGREKGCENDFMINLHKSMEPAGIDLTTPGSAVRLASVARHDTDCAMWPGKTPLFLILGNCDAK